MTWAESTAVISSQELGNCPGKDHGRSRLELGLSIKPEGMELVSKPKPLLQEEPE